MFRLLTTTALAACLAAPAMAESHTAQGDGAMGQGQATGQAQVRASHLTDMRLYMPENASDAEMTEVADAPDTWEMVGDIDDMVVTTDGQVAAILVDAGGYLGVGEDERRIDIENVRLVRDSDDEGQFFVVFSGDRSTFEQQQQFDEEQARTEGLMRASENERMAQEMDQSPQRQEESVEWSSISTEDLLGAPVYGPEGEWVGDLSELSVSDDGNVEGAIIDVGGFLGLGEKPVMLPIDDVEVRRTGYSELRAYVSATEEELESMDTWTPET